MRHAIEDVEYAEYLFDRFYGIGSCESGGVTRLGYTEVEDEMHRTLCELGKEKGYGNFADQVGNTYLYRTQYSKDEPYWLVGSHLDSVIEGGRYDGVAGIIAGLLVMSWAERDGLDLPIRVGAMRCEESSNFGRSTIAGPRRFRVHVHGNAEHSGATPMGMRTDALAAAAEIILEVEEIGKSEAMHQSVATVGVIVNHPNALNVIPGEVELGVDMRGIDVASLDRMEARLKAACTRICEKRRLTYFREKTSDIPPIEMSSETQQKLLDAAKRLRIPHRLMISGAGHDAMSFAHICDTGMVFIPCVKGISHNKKEFATIESILDGAMVMYEHLKEEAQ